MFTPSRHNREATYFHEEDPVGRDRIIFPALKAFRTSELTSRELVESPAKVFARMKAKVHAEIIPVENERTKTPNPVREKHVQKKRIQEEHGGVMNSPRKRHQHWVNYEQKETEDLEFTSEAEALTLSPFQSPSQGLTHSHFMVHPQDLQRQSPLKDMGSSAFKPTNINAQKQGPALDAFSTKSQRKALSYPHTLLSSNDTQQPAPLKDFKNASQTTNIPTPVTRSKSMEDCNGKIKFGSHNIVHDESFFRSTVVLDRLPCLDSKANTFALLKERRRKRDQQGYQVSSPQDPMKGCEHRVSAPAQPAGGTGEDASVNVTCSVPTGLSETSVPLRPDADLSQCEFYCDKPPTRPFPDLVHDPLLQVSPKISIPKKQEAVFQAKHLAESTGSNVTGIHLRHWLLKSRNDRFYVDGVREDNKMPWHSNLIAKRISTKHLKTASGSIYILVGKMSPDFSGTQLPKWLLKKFLFGFPKNWKKYLERFLSELERSEGKKGSNALITPQNQNHLSTKTQDNASQKLNAPKRSVLRSATSAVSSANVSRSGRLIKTPLEYWKGARVFVDSDMNVTIHGGYDNSSMLYSQVSTPVARVLLDGPPKPAKVFLPPAKERLRGDTSEEETMPLRKVKAYHRPSRSKPEENSPHRALESRWYKAEDNALSRVPKRPKNASPEPHRSMSLEKPSHRTRGRPNEASPSSQWSKPENPSTKGSGRPKRVSPASQRSKSEVILSPKLQGLPRKTGQRSWSATAPAAYTDRAPQSLTPPRRYLRGANKQRNDDSDNANTSSELLPGKQVKRSEKVDPPRVLDLPKTRVRPQTLPAKLRDDIVTARSYPQRLTRNRNVQYVGHSTDGESQSDDDFTQKKKPNAVKTGPIKPRGTMTRGRVPEDSQTASGGSSTSQGDCKRKLSKRASPQTLRGKGSKLLRVQQREKEENGDQWTEAELLRLHEAVTSLPKHTSDFWVNVAMEVGSRSAEDCQKQYNAQAPTYLAPSKATKKREVLQKREPVVEPPRITARKGTLKRKQQVRNLLDHMPKDDHDDIFNSSPMQNKRVKLPTVSPNGKEDVFMDSAHDPQTPSSSRFPSVKTPQCLHITPGMMGSVNRDNDDKYIYQLQKRMKKGQAKLHKLGAASKYTATPSAKRVLKRCNTAENDSFVVWEMFPDKEDHSVESGEEEDYYFMDDD
ncbi:mis18-binding protein 1 [Salmo salar]|uniref:Mis18-binding protein 1 n=1 Tax=Salmo salar TaxID=8030 RepID=A0A1S3SLX8_SALSA|nr:mis18-binding protein 1 [Salmo salar]|eukprot:XP_014065347.1 PREDICTED: mis18-binding protein 1 [Salmo salar]